MSSESIGRLHEAVVVYVYAATLVHARRTTVALGLECGAWAWLGWGLLGGNLGGGHCTRLLEIPREPCTEASPSGRMANCEPRTANREPRIAAAARFAIDTMPARSCCASVASWATHAPCS